LLGTSAVVTDMDLLATSAVITDLDLLATSANVTAMGLLGTSATVSDLSDVADNIDGVTSFADRYRVGSTNPTGSLDAGDLFFNTGDSTLKYYSGSTWASITAGIGSIADDTTPQLGGNLDINGNDIVSVSNADIDIIPNGSGDVNLGADTVQVGDNDANATITTQGTGDLTLNTNNGTNAGNVTLLDGANGNINLAPNGTGEIVVGAGDTAGDITSNGAYDLIVDTNGGTNAGNLTLTNGANGAITLTPNGTGVVAIEGSMNPSVSSTGKALVMGF